MPRSSGPSAEPRTKLRDSEVLGVAADVFYRRGYAGSSVQTIADELGILKGSLYYYISGKEELLYRVLLTVHAELGEILERALADTEPDPLERLRTYVAEQVEYAAHHVPQIAIYYRDGDQLSEAHREEIYARRREHATFVRELVQQAQRNGQAPADEDPRVLADLVFGSFIWTYRWYDVDGELDPAGLAQACGRFAVRALTAGGS